MFKPRKTPKTVVENPDRPKRRLLSREKGLFQYRTDSGTEGMFTNACVFEPFRDEEPGGGVVVRFESRDRSNRFRWTWQRADTFEEAVFLLGCRNRFKSNAVPND